MGPHLTPEARTLLLRQRGLIASWQGPMVAMSTRQLSRATSTGWQRLTPRTFMASEADPTPAQRRVAGVLDVGPDAALAGCSALCESGWAGDDGGIVDIIVARDHRFRGPRLPGWLRVHCTTNVPRRSGDPARTSVSRAAIDAAVWARTPRERLFILTSAVQQRVTGVERLRRELDSRHRPPWARQIREILADIEGGATSTSEADFRRACRAHGLPLPRMQVRHATPGRRSRVDAEFRLPDGRLLIVEIDGTGHMAVEQWQADLGRQNDLVAHTGALFLRVTSWQLRHEPDPFFSVVLGLFASSVCMQAAI